MKTHGVVARFGGLCLCTVLSASLLYAAQPPVEKHTPKESAAQPAKAAADEKAKLAGDPYALAVCPISGKKLGAMGDPVVKDYDGREVRFCCAMCPPNFEKDKDKSLAKLDEAMVKDQTPFYPGDTSIVSGKKLGAKPVDFVYNNRLVRLADPGEKAEFLKDPAKYLTALDKAVIAAQEKDYPLENCPVSKDALGSMGDSKNIVIANHLIRLCCKDCEADVRKDPAKVIAMIDAARKPGAQKAQPKADQKK